VIREPRATGTAARPRPAPRVRRSGDGTAMPEPVVALVHRAGTGDDVAWTP
jgi:hypothetical protein